MKDGKDEDFEEREAGGRQEKRIFVYWPKAEFEAALRCNGFEVVYYEYQPLSERSKWHRFVVRKTS